MSGDGNVQVSLREGNAETRCKNAVYEKDVEDAGKSSITYLIP